MSEFEHPPCSAAASAVGLVAPSATACGDGDPAAVSPGTSGAPSTPAAPVEVTRWHGQVDIVQRTLEGNLFVKHLANARRRRTTALPEVSVAVGRAVSTVLLGHGDLRSAHDGAAIQANTALAGQ